MQEHAGGESTVEKDFKASTTGSRMNKERRLGQERIALGEKVLKTIGVKEMWLYLLIRMKR